MVLHRPFEPAAQTGQAKCYFISPVTRPQPGTPQRLPSVYCAHEEGICGNNRITPMPGTSYGPVMPFRPWLNPATLPQLSIAGSAAGVSAPPMPTMRLGTSASSIRATKEATVSCLRQREGSRANFSSGFPARAPDSRPSGFRGLHHRFLHAVFACPVQTNLVAIGIIEIGMTPTPGHHAWQLGHVEALSLEIAAEVIQPSDFEIQTYTVAQNGIFRTHLMQRDRAIAARCAEACIHWLFVIVEVFDELESQQIAVEVESALHVFHVQHSVIESKLPASV